MSAHRSMVAENERLYQAFCEMDKNGDGAISKEELEESLNSTSTNTKQRERMLKAFGEADVNNDGTVDYEEFLRMLHPQFGSETAGFDEFVHTKDSRVHGADYNVDVKKRKMTHEFLVPKGSNFGKIEVLFFSLSLSPRVF